eukprot:12917692-Prorocentrum_lima.AAC.1
MAANLARHRDIDVGQSEGRLWPQMLMLLRVMQHCCWRSGWHSGIALPWEMCVLAHFDASLAQEALLTCLGSDP